VLENTFQLLRPVISLGAQSTQGVEQISISDDTHLEDRFANLTVEEAAEIAKTDRVGEQELQAMNSVVFEQDEAEVEEELMFAVGLLLQELQTMRDAACAQWEKYKRNEVIDLIVAAMTTDTAIRLAQKAEAEFDLVVKRPKMCPVNTHPV
jgi:hypothetical protein